METCSTCSYRGAEVTRETLSDGRKTAAQCVWCADAANSVREYDAYSLTR